jgi:hypothetical protein
MHCFAASPLPASIIQHFWPKTCFNKQTSGEPALPKRTFYDEVFFLGRSTGLYGEHSSGTELEEFRGSAAVLP